MIEKIDLSLMRFTRPSDEEQAIADISSGMNSPFWWFLVKVIDQNIAELDEELHEQEGLTTAENDSLKFRIKFLKKLKTLPEEQLSALKPSPDSEDEEDEDDPYQQVPDKHAEPAPYHPPKVRRSKRKKKND